MAIASRVTEAITVTDVDDLYAELRSKPDYAGAENALRRAQDSGWQFVRWELARASSGERL